MDFVLDASVTMAWCFEDEVTPYADGVLERLAENEAVVPPIWSLEVANVLLAGERRKRLTGAETTRFLEILRTLPIAVDEESLTQALGTVLALGRAQGLSAYDASYLELAARLGLPLATEDEALRQAAGRIGVGLFPSSANP